MPPILSFEAALQQTRDVKRHLLIGNGFSISLFPDRFRYDSLLQSADFSDYPQAREAFNVLGTSDFELVINALRQAVALVPLYGAEEAAREVMERHAEALKELLVEAIAGRHPERPSDISELQYKACRKFLANFAGSGRSEGHNLKGNIYSLNYDLLLYWTLLHEEIATVRVGNGFHIDFEESEEIAHDDGFRSPEDDHDAEYVTWDAEEAHAQNVHYLHGALHLFDHGFELQKRCWERSGGVPLIEQIRSALDENRFPLFVSEGQSQAKLARIRHSAYLHKALRSFRANCGVKKTAFFIYGHSLAANDSHVLKQIQRGKTERLYVSLYGDAAASWNQQIIANAALLQAGRAERFPLEIQFYDAATANVWTD